MQSLEAEDGDALPDITEVDRCVDQWPPDVSFLAQVDGSRA